MDINKLIVFINSDRPDTIIRNPKHPDSEIVKIVYRTDAKWLVWRVSYCTFAMDEMTEQPDEWDQFYSDEYFIGELIPSLIFYKAMDINTIFND